MGTSGFTGSSCISSRCRCQWPMQKNTKTKSRHKLKCHTQTNRTHQAPASFRTMFHAATRPWSASGEPHTTSAASKHAKTTEKYRHGHLSCLPSRWHFCSTGVKTFYSWSLHLETNKSSQHLYLCRVTTLLLRKLPATQAALATLVLLFSSFQ